MKFYPGANTPLFISLISEFCYMFGSHYIFNFMLFGFCVYFYFINSFITNLLFLTHYIPSLIIKQTDIVSINPIYLKQLKANLSHNNYESIDLYQDI